MSNHRLIRKDHLILIAAAAPMLIIASSLIGIDGYFGTPKIAYSQSDQDQMNSNTTKSVNIQDIPLEKVRVGDIEMAYKMFGKGDPIILHSGASDNNVSYCSTRTWISSKSIRYNNRTLSSCFHNSMQHHNCKK